MFNFCIIKPPALPPKGTSQTALGTEQLQCYKVSLQFVTKLKPSLSSHTLQCRLENGNTSLEWFLSLTNFPSASISSIDIFPEAETCWIVLNAALCSLFLVSLIFLFFPCRNLRPWLAAWVAVLCEDGLGDSFSLEESQITFTWVFDVLCFFSCLPFHYIPA